MGGIFCVKCGEELILEDDPNVCEDKDFYCEECWSKEGIDLEKSGG